MGHLWGASGARHVLVGVRARTGEVCDGGDIDGDNHVRVAVRLTTGGEAAGGVVEGG